MRRFTLGLAIALVVVFAVPRARAQFSSRPTAPNRQPVEFLYPEHVAVAAGKPATVALHFRVAPGLHINSHTPGEAELIPTALSLSAGSEVKLDGAAYPKGERYTLPADPKTALDVYTGEFIVEARLVAAPGLHLVEAHLRYQACDNAACMPPKTLTIAIDVEGK